MSNQSSTFMPVASVNHKDWPKAITLELQPVINNKNDIIVQKLKEWCHCKQVKLTKEEHQWQEWEVAKMEV